jgi:hypothetical protein
VKKGGPEPTDVHVGKRVRMRRMMLGMSQEADRRSGSPAWRLAPFFCASAALVRSAINARSCSARAA